MSVKAIAPLDVERGRLAPELGERDEFIKQDTPPALASNLK